jgi:hypothetical protein
MRIPHARTRLSARPAARHGRTREDARDPRRSGATDLRKRQPAAAVRQSVRTPRSWPVGSVPRSRRRTGAARQCARADCIRSIVVRTYVRVERRSRCIPRASPRARADLLRGRARDRGACAPRTGPDRHGSRRGRVPALAGRGDPGGRRRDGAGHLRALRRTTGADRLRPRRRLARSAPDDGALATTAGYAQATAVAAADRRDADAGRAGADCLYSRRGAGNDYLVAEARAFLAAGASRAPD